MSKSSVLELNKICTQERNQVTIPTSFCAWASELAREVGSNQTPRVINNDNNIIMMIIYNSCYGD